MRRYARLLQLTTAHRQGEIASMRWNEINGESESTVIPMNRAEK